MLLITFRPHKPGESVIKLGQNLNWTEVTSGEVFHTPNNITPVMCHT